MMFSENKELLQEGTPSMLCIADVESTECQRMEWNQVESTWGLLKTCGKQECIADVCIADVESTHGVSENKEFLQEGIPSIRPSLSS